MERISLSIFSFFFFMNLESLRICNWIRGPRFFFLLQVSVAFAVFRPSSINPACITVLSKYRVFSVVMISHAIRIVCRVSFFVCSHRCATYDSERMKSVVAVILRIYPQTLNIRASCNKIWKHGVFHHQDSSISSGRFIIVGPFSPSDNFSTGHDPRVFTSSRPRPHKQS